MVTKSPKTAKKSKKVVILNGSPRKKGNTAVLVNWLENACKQKNWQVIRHDLYYMDFKGCAHCDACKKFNNKPACILRDDFSAVLEQITAADAIVLASPVYCWSVSGCLSAALDRFYAFFKSDGKSLIAKKKLAGLFTAGGDCFAGMDLCVASLKWLCDHAKAEYVGSIGAGSCKSPAKLAQNRGLKNEVSALIAGF